MSDKTIRILDHEISRRDAIKAGGIAGLGLAFSTPLIRSFRPKPAFAGPGDGCNPSLELGDIVGVAPTFQVPGTIFIPDVNSHELSVTVIEANCGSCGYEPCEETLTYCWEIGAGVANDDFILQNNKTATPSISCKATGIPAQLNVTVTLTCFSPGCGSSTADATASIGLECVD